MGQKNKKTTVYQVGGSSSTNGQDIPILVSFESYIWNFLLSICRQLF